MKERTILISGGSGFVGSRLAAIMAEVGIKVIILTRNPKKSPANIHPLISYAKWDIGQQYIDPKAIALADAVVHLAGAGVMDKRWNKAYKQEILDSRIQSSALICKALQNQENKVKVVLSASAIGWYGADKLIDSQPFTENAPVDTGFLGVTCKAWEDSIQPVEALGKRLVISRIGIVLGKTAGAFPEFMHPLQFRVAAVLGNGQQMVSWIHLDDLCRWIMMALDQDCIAGVYNAVAPIPVTNKVLTLTLAKALYHHSFITIPVPAFLLSMMLGESSIEVLKSANVSSQKIQSTGFTFVYHNIEAAIRNLLDKEK